ncbi:MAG: GYDIA family GHMP kinase [Bacteroidales bacterium]|nr:GYDIA family GHMP kinase [Bacteroidales bacterium]
MTDSKLFKANGKLMLTGEYFVLHGAKSLAMPVNKGQQMQVAEISDNNAPHINWLAKKPDKDWFYASFSLPELNIIQSDDRPKAIKLQLILLTLQQLNPKAFAANTSYTFTTLLEFEPEWGFGSSSSLLVILSRWAKVNPYTLLNFSIGGSGYDIACGQSKSPLIYQLTGLLPHQKPIAFRPPFAEKLYFVYQGKKQDSAKAVHAFKAKNHKKDLSEEVQRISEITQEVAATTDFENFCALMREHEAIVSAHIGLDPVQDTYPDFEGQLKSLGAWGGDFLLAATPWPESAVRAYFSAKGLETLFCFDELTLKP